jgi:hypothetical protein
MVERDVFEARLRGALSRYVADGPTDVDALEFARTVAAAEPRQRGRAGSIAAALAGRSGGGRPWRTILVPPAGRSPAFRIAWIAAVVGLLLAAVLSAAFVGGELLRRLNEPTVVPPALVDLTTKAKPLPAEATCPPGSNPDAPGPADQERLLAAYGTMAFDRHAGRVVVLGSDEESRPRTWTFDVCGNTWQRMNPPVEPPLDDPVRLVYDADSDRTLGFTSDGGIWSYDLGADRWTKRGLHPGRHALVGWTTGAAAVYHDPSGLVIVYDGDSMSAYDVETDTMTQVRQLPDPSRPVGSGMPDGVTAAVYDRDRNQLLAVVAAPDDLRGSSGDAGFYISDSRPYKPWVQVAELEIWAFDPGTGVWRLVPSQVPARILWEHDGYFFGPVSRVAYDQAVGAAVFLSREGWVEAYDGQRSWQADPEAGDMRDGSSNDWCETLDPVFDSVHGRIVCQVRGGGVSSFSTVTGRWRWLLKPEPTPSPD